MMADRKRVEPLLRTARGQLDGVLRMIDENRYCMDIVTQLQAVESLVHKAQREVLRAHLNGCVRDAFDEKRKSRTSVREKLKRFRDAVSQNKNRERSREKNKDRGQSL